MTPHLLKSMEDRRFSEVDQRTMLNKATSYHPDFETGRWALVTRHQRRQWEVIVEPDADAKVLVVVTAYRIEGKR